MANNMLQETGVASEAGPDARDQLASYLEQQPQSRRTFDKVMKALELAGLALVVGYLAWAIYISINWSVPQNILAVWLAFPISVVVLLVLVGVHAAGLGAFPPVVVPGGPQGLDTGRKAVAMGLGLTAMLLLASAFWGVFAWGIWTNNRVILKPLIQILGVVAGVGAVIAVISSLFRQVTKSL